MNGLYSLQVCSFHGGDSSFCKAAQSRNTAVSKNALIFFCCRLKLILINTPIFALYCIQMQLRLTTYFSCGLVFPNVAQRKIGFSTNHLNSGFVPIDWLGLFIQGDATRFGPGTKRSLHKSPECFLLELVHWDIVCKSSTESPFPTSLFRGINFCPVRYICSVPRAIAWSIGEVCWCDRVHAVWELSRQSKPTQVRWDRSMLGLITRYDTFLAVWSLLVLFWLGSLKAGP